LIAVGLAAVGEGVVVSGPGPGAWSVVVQSDDAGVG